MELAGLFIAVTIILGIIILVFLAVRAFVLWYFRVNTIVERLEEIAAAAREEKNMGEKVSLDL